MCWAHFGTAVCPMNNCREQKCTKMFPIYRRQVAHIAQTHWDHAHWDDVKKDKRMVSLLNHPLYICEGVKLLSYGFDTWKLNALKVLQHSTATC